jgi:hypothetical protein
VLHRVSNMAVSRVRAIGLQSLESAILVSLAV